MSLRIDLFPHARVTALLVVLAALGPALAPPAARAGIDHAVTIDGPSPEISDFGGIAMSRDGTGGIVYLRRMNGVAHVFASRYVSNRWRPPMQVDAGQPFAASSPRIAAANGGRLLVTWATPWSLRNGKPVQQLMSSFLSPGAGQFGQAIIVDPDIDGGSGLDPSLSMSPTGQADVAYRVVTNTLSSATLPIAPLHPGDVEADIRVARFNGLGWSSVGTVNRNPAFSMRPPAADNGPQISVGPDGNGVVVWQEPDVSGAARIWARRIFGATPGNVVPVSGTSFQGSPLSGDADAFALDTSDLGLAEVVYRQSAPTSSALGGARLFASSMQDRLTVDGAASFAAPVLADGAGASAPAGGVGAPGVGVDANGNVRLAFASGGLAHVVSGDTTSLTGSVALTPAATAGTTPAQATIATDGGGATAWAGQDAQGTAGLAVREDFPSGAAQTALLGAAAGGPVTAVAAGRSGLGDALVGFRQGTSAAQSIAAVRVTSPPGMFRVTTTSNDWVLPSKARISWDRPADATGGLSYALVIDGRVEASGLHHTRARPVRHGLADGVHQVQVLAADADGSETLSDPTQMKVDGTAPVARVRRGPGRRSVVLTLTDTASGVDRTATVCSWGDGTSTRRGATLRHTYKRAGHYAIVLRTRDKLSNARTVELLVRAR